jgi:hypothetical protein
MFLSGPESCGHVFSVWKSDAIMRSWRHSGSCTYCYETVAGWEQQNRASRHTIWVLDFVEFNKCRGTQIESLRN